MLSKEVNVLTIAAICNLTVKSPPLPSTKALFTSTEATPSLTVTELISIALSKIGYFCWRSAFNMASNAAFGVTLSAAISTDCCLTPEPSSVGTKNTILTDSLEALAVSASLLTFTSWLTFAEPVFCI